MAPSFSASTMCEGACAANGPTPQAQNLGEPNSRQRTAQSWIHERDTEPANQILINRRV